MLWVAVDIRLYDANPDWGYNALASKINRGVCTWKLGDQHVLIHRSLDGRIFIGQLHIRLEAQYPPKFFSTLEAALIYLALVADDGPTVA